MTPDATPPEDALQALPPAVEFHATPAPRRRGRGVLFAGVAGACVLGAGAGLWARPGMSERQLAVSAPTSPAPAGPVRTLQVVVDNRPVPLGAPMQVLPTGGARPAGPMALPVFTGTAATPEAAVRAPVVPPPAPVQVAGAEPPAPKPSAVARFAPIIASALAAPKMLITLEAPKPPPILLAKADPPRKSEADRATARAAAAHRLALAQAAREEAAGEKAEAARAAREEAAQTRFAELKVAQVKAAQVKAAQAKAAQIQLAKAEAAKAAKTDHLAKLAQAHMQAKAQAKAEKAEAIRLAKAEAKGRAEARAEARADALAEARAEAQKQIRLASLVRTLKRVIPHERPRAEPVRTAKLDRKHGKKAGRHDPVIERASARKAPRAAEPPSRVHAFPVPPPQRASGLMKVSAPRCGQRDPGEALVCADPNLGAADRQLARAYQGARAAGVPDAQLLRQQQRWLAARTAAAREAPWAVHDVYMARIAELNGLAREAHGDGY
jgi:hypothetical protein